MDSARYSLDWIARTSTSLRSRLRTRSTGGQTINCNLGNNDAEAHRQNDVNGGHAVRDCRTQEIQSRIRAIGKLDEAAGHSEQEYARYHRDYRSKANGREWHMTVTGDWREDQPDQQTGNERAGRCTSANRKSPPPQSMGQHSDCDRPAQHTQWRRKEYAISADCNAGSNSVEQ